MPREPDIARVRYRDATGSASYRIDRNGVRAPERLADPEVTHSHADALDNPPAADVADGGTESDD